jgi:hypothetical protein
MTRYLLKGVSLALMGGMIALALVPFIPDH